MKELAEKIWNATAEFSGSKEEYCALVQSVIDEHFKGKAKPIVTEYDEYFPETDMNPEMLDSSKGPQNIQTFDHALSPEERNAQYNASQSLQDRAMEFDEKSGGGVSGREFYADDVIVEYEVLFTDDEMYKFAALFAQSEIERELSEVQSYIYHTVAEISNVDTAIEMIDNYLTTKLKDHEQENEQP